MRAYNDDHDPDRRNELRLQHVEKHGVNLTTWEDWFIMSIRTQVDQGYTLTDRQIEILDRIYTDRTP